MNPSQAKRFQPAHDALQDYASMMLKNNKELSYLAAKAKDAGDAKGIIGRLRKEGENVLGFIANMSTFEAVKNPSATMSAMFLLGSTLIPESAFLEMGGLISKLDKAAVAMIDTLPEGGDKALEKLAESRAVMLARRDFAKEVRRGADLWEEGSPNWARMQGHQDDIYKKKIAKYKDDFLNRVDAIRQGKFELPTVSFGDGYNKRYPGYRSRYSNVNPSRRWYRGSVRPPGMSRMQRSVATGAPGPVTVASIPADSIRSRRMSSIPGSIYTNMDETAWENADVESEYFPYRRELMDRVESNYPRYSPLNSLMNESMHSDRSRMYDSMYGDSNRSIRSDMSPMYDSMNDDDRYDSYFNV